MKVNGPNKTNLNPYNNQLQKQTEIKKNMDRTDQLEISNEAKQLLKNEQPNTKRAAYVQDIKDAVESGKYEVNYGRTAQKMIDFWSKR